MASPGSLPSRNLESSFDHKDADAKVLEALALMYPSATPDNDRVVPPFAIVSTVATNCPQYMLGQDKLVILWRERGADLTPYAQKAWRDQSFKSLRSLSILQQKSRASRDDDSKLANEVEATKKSWTATYRGRAHELLRNSIVEIERSRTEGDSYGNTMPIIQSSGTGKSRMVDELATIEFVFPFNLRRKEETVAFAYPDPDDSVRDFFIDCEGKTRLDVGMQYCAFLIVLFEYTDTILHQNKSVILAHAAPLEHNTLASWWRGHLGTKRLSIYNETIKRSRTVLEELKIGDEQKLQDRGKARVGDASLKLRTTVRTLSGRDDALVVLYFDESHDLHATLDAADTSPHPHTRYTTLCWALDLVSRTNGLFTLFLSTNSHLGNYAPQPKFHSSARINDPDTVNLLAPYTELPFDCFLGRIHPAQLTLGQTSDTEFLCKFGRPLFWSRYDSGTNDVRRDIISFAKKKLAPNVTAPSSIDSQLAVLDTRLLLSFERSEVGAVREEILVQSRMRIAYSVPKHRIYMYSGYPSEPILAEASAHCWTDLTTAGISIPGLLASFMENGYIGKGERGELVTRLLFTLAFDAAVKRHHSLATGPQHTRQYTLAVPLSVYLEELFGDYHAERILDSKPNMGGVKFRDAFANAHVRFTHFIRAGDSSIVSTLGAYASALRSSAIQCSSGQKTIDIVVPIVLGDPHSTCLEEAVMSSILISIKDKNQASNKAETYIDASKLDFFPSTQSTYNNTDFGRPYIAMVLELGVQQPHSAAPNSKGTPAKVVIETPPTRNTLPRGVAVNPQPLKNPKYTIRVYGCSPTVYKVVTEKARYSLLLGSNNLLGEHARGNPESRAAVMQMKPYWRMLENCYHWLAGVETPTEDPSPAREEGVVIGDPGSEDGGAGNVSEPAADPFTA